MKKILPYLLLLPCLAMGQISNFNDETNYISALNGLAQQCFTPFYNETDPDKGTRQHMELNPETMNLVYYQTPYDSEEDTKKPEEIEWLVKYEIPVYDIDKLVGDTKKNTITIKMKDDNPSIQSYTIVSGSQYGTATKEYELVIQSNKLLKIRNLEKRMNNDINELQAFHAKKLELVEFLNKKLKEEEHYQVKDSANYPEDRKFKVVQPFQLDAGGQWLSVAVERKSYNEGAVIEKQAVPLKDVLAITKDINILFECTENKTLVTITTLNSREEQTSKSGLFFLHLCYEKDNPGVGNKIAALFKKLGIEIKNETWYD